VCIKHTVKSADPIRKLIDDGWVLAHLAAPRSLRAAERAGTTAHNFILEALTEKTGQAERRAEFMDTAEQRYAQIAASGKAVPWSEMRKHLERRIAGEKSMRPKSRTLAR